MKKAGDKESDADPYMIHTRRKPQLIDFETIYILFGLVLFWMIRLSLFKGSLRSKTQLAVESIFVSYCIVVLGMTLLPIPIEEREGFPKPSINFIPFSTILELVGSGLFLKQIVGNIILFIPMGFLLPFIWQMARDFLKAVLIGLFISLTVESTQLLVSDYMYKVFDVDDILLNTIGTAMGWLIYRFVRPFL